MSKIKELAGKTASIQPRQVDHKSDRALKTAPVMMYDATARMHAAEQRAEELESQLREAESRSSTMDIELEELHEAPGRKRSLTDEQYLELRENLRGNELVTPITVRPRQEGGYEIVSGHNRVRAFKELGRPTISAVVSNADSAQADINAFYANLLQPTLPDYEKYLGFKLILQRRADLSQEKIAELVGVSPASLSRLLSFDNLPKEAHVILKANPGAVGATAASTLGTIAKSGRQAKVIEAIQKVVAEGIDQNAAIAFAKRPDEGTLQKNKGVEITAYKIGKSPLCSYRKTDTTLRIDFKDPEHARAVHEAIQEVLKKYAADTKAGKN